MADTTVRGINIEFGAEDAAFTKSLKQINKELNSTAQLGKAVDKSLKFDPTNVKLLNDKLTVTQSELKGSESKAKALEKELKKLDDLTIEDLNQQYKELGEEFDDLNSEAKVLKKELKALEEAGQIDTTQYEKLNQELKDTELKASQTSEAQKALNEDIKNLDPVQYQNLQKQLANSLNDINRLNAEQNRLNQDIKALETEQYDQLSDKTKKAAVNVGDLTSEQVGYNQAASQSVSSTEGFSLSLSKAATAATAATAAIKAFTANTRASAATTLEFSNSINTTNLDLDALGDSARTVSTVFDIEFNEALDLASATMAIFGNEVNTADQFTNAMIISTQFLNSEVGSLQQIVGLFNDVQSDANSTTLDAVNIYRDADKAIKIYGTSADDVVDSFREWFPLFQELGVSATEFNNILISGLELGAKSTDEVANAFNELVLKIGDGSLEASGSLEVIGLTFQEIDQTFQNEGITAVFIDIIEALNASTEGMSALEEQTFVTNLAFSLFGTAGEEFVSQLATNDEAVQGLVNTQESLIAQEQTLANLQGVLTTSNAELSAILGLTTTQQANLAVATERSAIAGLKYLISTQLSKEQLEGFKEAQSEGIIALAEYTKTLDLQGESMRKLYENGFIATETFQNFLTIQGLNQEEGVKSALAFFLESGALEKLAEKGLISQAQLEALNEAQGIFGETLQLVNNQITSQINTMLVNSEALGLNRQETNTLNEAMKTLSSTEATAQEKTQALSDSMIIYANTLDLSSKEGKELNDNTRILNDTNSSAKEKVDALRSSFQILTANGLEPNLEVVNKVKNSTETLNTALNSQKLATENTEQALFNINKEQTTSVKGLKDYKKAVSAVIPDLKKLRAELKNNRDEMIDFTKETRNSKSAVDDLTSSIQSFNNTPVAPKSVDVETSSNSNSLGVSQSDFSPAEGISALDFNSLGAVPNATTNNNVFNLRIQVSAETTEPERLAADLAKPMARELAKYI